jgi:hypothetical protein
MVMPNADDVRNIPGLLECLGSLRDNAVANQNFPVAVLWRDMRDAVAEYNELDAHDAKDQLSVLGRNLRLVASVIERLTNTSHAQQSH